MHTTIILSAILGLVVLQARAADVPTRSCDQIREQIAARPECQFVAAELYRARMAISHCPNRPRMA